MPILRLVLIKIHGSNLLLQFGLSLLFFLLLLLFGLLSLLLLLTSPELVEHILVMQDCMGEFILKIIFVQQLLDPVSDDRRLQELVDIGPFGGISLKHRLEQHCDVLGKVGRHCGVLALDDLLGQLMQALRVEGWLQSAHLVEQHA